MIYEKGYENLKGNTFRQIIENLKYMKIAFKNIDKKYFLLLLINWTK